MSGEIFPSMKSSLEEVNLVSDVFSMFQLV